MPVALYIKLRYHSPMTVQLFGTKKSADTRKAERFFKERKIAYQFIDLTQKGPSKGELESILRHVDSEELIDTNSKLYKKGGYAYMDFDPIEEVLEHPELLAQPIIRGKNFACIGYSESLLKEMEIE